MENAISTNNFNEQLYLMISSLQSTSDEEENMCLITDMPLKENYVKLECGHRFNYNAIFNEVKKQKCMYNHLEVTRLKKKEIKCPYCRRIQNGLLPYCDGFEKIRLVNHPQILQFLPNKCNYIFASGKKKGQSCGKQCLKDYCISHEKIILKRKEKQLLKEEKQLLKEQKQLLKEQKKLKKELKTKQKNIITEIQNIKIKTPTDDPMIKLIDKMLDDVKNMKLTNVENKVSNIKTLLPTCCYKFKRGKNKGMQCKCKKIHEDGLCKMHYKLYIKAQQKMVSTLEN
tara:strand:+ start:3063 stop:3917 length:855 start_codon:yes stop_codon:yes gene_type:complete